jgi:type I restriction enzyme S subunit
VKSRASGTTFAEISGKAMAAVPLLLAPYKEQERIVAAIEEQFSRLDVGESALRRARQNVKRMRAAVLEAAVTGHLLDTDGASRIINYSVGESLPPEWAIVPVREIAEVSGGITKNPKRLPRKNAIPFLRVANVMRDQLDLREVHEIEVFDGELERLRLQRGDLLVVEGNGSPDQIGRSAIWDGSIDPCVHQNHLIRVRPGNKILPEYLNIFWNAPSSMMTIQAAASSTSGLHTLSTGKIRNIQVAVPPLPMQHRIIEEVDRQLSALNALDKQLEIVEARGRILRMATLATAFSGKLVPQDESDEPASTFLAFIASERESVNTHRLTRRRKPRVLVEEVTA